MPIVNGQIVVANGYGISIDDVGIALGYVSRELELLCKSPLIKEKALHKPINIDKWILGGPYGSPTDAERLSVNYGHTYNTSNDPYAILRGWLAGMSTWFPYNKPSTKFRIQDFNGYDLQPNNWFDLSTKNASVGTSDNKILWRLNYEFLFNHIAVLASMTAPQNTLNFGFFMWTGELSNNLYWYQVTNVANNQTLPDLLEDGGRIPMLISGKVTEGQWNVVPAFYSGNQMPGGVRPTAGSMNAISDKEGVCDGQFYLFPYCDKAIINVTGGGIDPDIDILKGFEYEIHASTTCVDYADQVYRLDSMELVVRNAGDKAANIVLTDFSIIGAIIIYGSLPQTMTTGTIESGEVAPIMLYDGEKIAENERLRFRLIESGSGVTQVKFFVKKYGSTATPQEATADYDYTISGDAGIK